jgi:predicted HicB family RNase H-like nuclease
MSLEMEKMKMLKVDSQTHKQIKTEAAKNGLTIAEFVKMLIQKFVGND